MDRIAKCFYRLSSGRYEGDSVQRKTCPDDIADTLLIRLPVGMRGRIEHAAKEAGRSMNDEVMARLEQSFKNLDTADTLVGKVEYLERQNKELWEALEDLRHNIGVLYRIKRSSS